MPKRKRPKTLQYLMRTKTYIKWPMDNQNSPHSKSLIINERKIFWRRLKKALAENEWEDERTQQHPEENSSTASV